jgi:hypothetical protein
VRRWILAGAGLLLAALVLAGRADRPSAAPTASRTPGTLAPPTRSPEPPGSAGETAARPLRDLFRYADEGSGVAPAPAAALAPPLALTATPEPPVRLVGLVRQPGGVRAAIAIHGEVVLLRPGETAQGWTLVALGEDGARLRGPDGHHETVALPE